MGFGLSCNTPVCFGVLIVSGILVLLVITGSTVALSVRLELCACYEVARNRTAVTLWPGDIKQVRNKFCGFANGQGQPRNIWPKKRVWRPDGCVEGEGRRGGQKMQWILVLFVLLRLNVHPEAKRLNRLLVKVRSAV